jgi:hypothetical protein
MLVHYQNRFRMCAGSGKETPNGCKITGYAIESFGLEQKTEFQERMFSTS